MLTVRRLATLFLAVCFTFLLFSLLNARKSWHTQAVGFGEASPSEQATAGTAILPYPRETPPSPEDDSTLFSFSAAFVPGIAKPANDTYTRTLVLARTSDEDTSWVEAELSDMLSSNGGPLSLAIYTVDNASAPLHPPANKGHEAMVYLTYIIDHYNASLLADVSIFSHAHRFGWHNNEHLADGDAAFAIRRLSPARVVRDGYMNLRCTWDPGCPNWLHPAAAATTPDDDDDDDDIDKFEEPLLAAAWTQLFPADPVVPPVLAQPCCAQFAVSRARILATPRARYVAWRRWLLATALDDYLAGRVFEYLWQVVFAGRAVVCPPTRVCYCDGYGLCFGGLAAFDDWFQLRSVRRGLEDELWAWRDARRAARVAGPHDDHDAAAGSDLLRLGLEAELGPQVEAMDRELERGLQEALRRGMDPRARALEAGREWHDGDGF